MKIVIAGGGGQLGTLLARARHAAGDDVVVLSRAPRQAPWRTARWDAKTLGPWAAELEGADVIFNLAGRSVNCRYTPENRRAIIDSRVDSTRVVGEAIARAAAPPKLWLQMSTATIYAHRYDAPNDERTGIIGGDEPGVPETWRFSIERRDGVGSSARRSRRAERGTQGEAAHGDRDVADTRQPVRHLIAARAAGRGRSVGDGRQFVSWIHCADFVRAVDWIIANER